MKNKEQIQREAEQTLNSLDGITQVESNEFLYAKVMNRMQARQQYIPARYGKLMVRLSLALGLFLGLNLATYIVLDQRQHVAPRQASSGTNAFAEDYQLNNNTYNY